MSTFLVSPDQYPDMPASTLPPEQQIATFVAGLSLKDVPDDFVKLTKRAFVDTVGVTLAGAATGAGGRTGAFAERRAGMDDGVTLLGRTGRASLPTAVLTNGTAGHALDYDDLSWGMDGHPSVSLVAPALGVGEFVEADGASVITAYAAGFETMCYLAEPISPTHYERGWHATATFGTFGATVAACRLLDIDSGGIRNALAIAASTPAGLKRNFGTMTKPLHAGLACRSGVTAALLAADGFTADERAIGGDQGFWELYGDGAESVPDPPGSPWRSIEHGINVKKYPCCYFTHSAIAATQKIAAEAKLTFSDIKSIRVTASPGAADALVHENPSTGLEAKFSMEYCVGIAIARERVDTSAFQDDNVNDSTAQTVRKTVTFDVDNALPYDSHTATVRIQTTDGRDFKETMYNPPGTSENPLSEAAMKAKFTECASGVLPEDQVTRVYETLVDLGEQRSILTVLSQL